MLKASLTLLLACLCATLAVAQEKPDSKQQSIREAEAQAQEQRRRAEIALQAAEKERLQSLQARDEAEKQKAIAEQLRAEAIKQAELAKAAADAEAAARKEAIQAKKAAEDALESQRQVANEQRAIAEQNAKKALMALEAERRAKVEAMAVLEALKKAQANSPDAQPKKAGRKGRRPKVAELAEQVEALSKQVKQMQAELNALKGQRKTSDAKPGLSKTQSLKQIFDKELRTQLEQDAAEFQLDKSALQKQAIGTDKFSIEDLESRMKALKSQIEKDIPQESLLKLREALLNQKDVLKTETELQNRLERKDFSQDSVLNLRDPSSSTSATCSFVEVLASEPVIPTTAGSNRTR
jgi:hypothetical protein